MAAPRTIRRPSTRNQAPREWTPRDYDALAPDDQEWCMSVADKLGEYRDVATAENLARSERWRLKDALSDLLKLLAGNTEAITAERAWPLASAAEKAASAWLRSTEQFDGPAFDADLNTPYYSIEEGWQKFCNPPELIQTRTVTIESLAELDRLPGVSDASICSIFATADPIDEDSQWGPWITPGGLLPSANFERLRAARAGRAKTPTTRSITTRLPGWPTRQPPLLLLRQIVGD